MTEQNVYEARLTRSLLQDKSVRIGVLSNAPPIWYAAITKQMATPTPFQQKTLGMIAWVEGILADQSTAGKQRLSAIGVVCILYRLVYYAEELKSLLSWEQKVETAARIQECVQILYEMLHTSLGCVEGIILSMTVMFQHQVANRVLVIRF